MIRIVKMVFTEESVDSFLKMFDHKKEFIRAFEGCTHLELLQDKNQPYTLFTYSIWESEAHLQAYRESALFAETWAETKTYFGGKPEAWSVNSIRQLL
ncbi:MAG: antibiotic biosynthesis monooxygenase [Bacteroidetes bacterium]|nr:antibiotic biosynthesis monooxygenase [Bacteroidota bacterium]